MMRKVEISHVELMALKKLALVVRALANSFESPTAKRETSDLLSVLVDVTSRADLAQHLDGRTNA